jgi:hypothetical protein
MKTGFGQSLIDAGLIRAKRSSTLQQQGDALERGALLYAVRPVCDGILKVHAVYLCC